MDETSSPSPDSTAGLLLKAMAWWPLTGGGTPLAVRVALDCYACILTKSEPVAGLPVIHGITAHPA